MPRILNRTANSAPGVAKRRTPRSAPPYDNSIDGFDFTYPRRAVARILIRGEHIADIVSRFDRHEFPPSGFPDAVWFDQVLTHLASPWRFPGRPNATFRRRQLEGISRVAQIALPKCPVALNGEGKQVSIWGEIAVRLVAKEYRVVELLVAEFPRERRSIGPTERNTGFCSCKIRPCTWA